MLADSLKQLLANSYSFVIKAQQFHWNVEGPDFPQYHKFFGKFYIPKYTIHLIRQQSIFVHLMPIPQAAWNAIVN